MSIRANRIIPHHLAKKLNQKYNFWHEQRQRNYNDFKQYAYELFMMGYTGKAIATACGLAPSRIHTILHETQKEIKGGDQS